MTNFRFSLVRPSLQTTCRCLVSSYILVFSFASIAASQNPNPTWSIQSASAFALLRRCGQTCLGQGYELPGNGNGLQCPSPYLNACVCRTDLASSASSFLALCISTEGCSSNSDDVTSAVSLYNSYCSANGYIRSASVATTTSDGTSLQPTITIVTIPRSTSFTTAPVSTESVPLSSTSTLSSTSAPTSTTTPISSTLISTSTTSISGTSTPATTPAPSTNVGAIAGGVVGGIAGLAIIVAILSFLVRRRGSPSPTVQERSHDAGRYFQPSELPPANLGVPYGSPAPTYSSTSPLPPEIYGTALFSPKYPTAPAYEVSAEKH